MASKNCHQLDAAESASAATGPCGGWRALSLESTCFVGDGLIGLRRADAELARFARQVALVLLELADFACDLELGNDLLVECQQQALLLTHAFALIIAGSPHEAGIRQRRRA